MGLSCYSDGSFFKGCPGAVERTRDLLISFISSFHHFTAEPQRIPNVGSFLHVGRMSLKIQAFWNLNLKESKGCQLFLCNAVSLSHQGCQIAYSQTKNPDLSNF
jgi:hypothetical protein